MPSYVPCKKNDSNGYIFYVSLVSQADTKVMQANPTLAAGDVKIAVDDAAPGNLGTLPVADADFTKRVKVTLSQAETNGDNLTIIFSDAAGAEWCDLTINIQTSAQTLDTIETNVTTIEAKTNLIGASVALEAGGNVAAIKAKTDLIGASVALESAGNLEAVKAKTDLIPADITTQLDTNVPAIKAKTDLLPADTVTQLDTNIPAIKAKTDLIPADITTQLDTNVPAIKAQTDKLLFDVSNFVKSIAQNTELAHLDADISSRETPAHVTATAALLAAEIDDLITRAKGLNEIYDSVALRALEATLTAIKGAGWSSETLKAIYDAIASAGTAPQVIRDAMKLAPSVGVPADGSVDKHLDDIETGVDELESKASFSV